jgi:diguanylate cyclase (GGDEF)-like protein
LGYSRPAVSLRRTLLLRALLLAFGSSLLVTLGFVVLGMLPVLDRVAESDFKLAAERVEARLSQTFEPEARQLAISLAWIGSSAPDVDDPVRFNEFFMPVLATSPFITSVVAGTSSGQGWMLLQGREGQWHNRLTDIPRWGKLQHFIDFVPGVRWQERWETVDYDARERPWFTGALTEAPGTVHWTRPYTFFTTGDPGITASRRITLADGQELVIGFDLSLRDLSAATLDAQVGRQGLALIVTESGRVLGLPRRPDGVAADAWLAKVLLPVSSLGIDAVRDLLPAWRNARGQPIDVAHFVSDGARWLFSARAYRLGKQNFWVLVLAPAADFAPAWTAIGFGLVGGLLLLLATAGTVAQLQARSIARPLETLAMASKRIGSLDFSPHEPVRSEIVEIAQLAQAQESMREMLHRNQLALRDHAERLNAQVRELREAEDRINTLAFYDPLTGLPNRRLLSDRLQRALTSCVRNHHRGALLFIDLDNFKTLNDTLGHDLGDRLLKEMGARLAATVREGDTAARLGGDEFVLVLEGLSADEDDAVAHTRVVGAKLLEALTKPYQLGGHETCSTASIGATLFEGQAINIDELFKQADLAMYQAKAEGRNRLCFYGPAMQAQLSERAALEADLRRALLQEQFELHYQPQVNSAGALIGVEALLRWNHPQRSVVSPRNFIPVAEDTGLILDIGRWVLVSACKQLAEWADVQCLTTLTMSVNVSARQFRHPDFVDEVRSALDFTGAESRLLRLELTESLLLEDVETVIDRMHALRALGVGFSLDDFGTGYSSLSYLKRLPLTELKIDMSFVRDVLVDPNDAAISRTIIALAHTMGLSVIAEGVESEAQRSFLERSGCDAYQGYLFGRPAPAAQIVQFAQALATGVSRPST